MSEYERFRAQCEQDVEAQGSDDEFLAKTRTWIGHAMEHRYSYHFEWFSAVPLWYVLWDHHGKVRLQRNYGPTGS